MHIHHDRKLSLQNSGEDFEFEIVVYVVLIHLVLSRATTSLTIPLLFGRLFTWLAFREDDLEILSLDFEKAYDRVVGAFWRGR